jgi:hypothetical protein
MEFLKLCQDWTVASKYFGVVLKNNDIVKPSYDIIENSKNIWLLKQEMS